jgi:formate hydrogenlyase subunit 6/NADH:ubiquinone oxidoreductase subunit I
LGRDAPLHKCFEAAAGREPVLPESDTNGGRQPMDLSSARVPVGRVHVIAERCKQCNFCINYCPTKMLEYSTEINAKGYHFPVVTAGKEMACVHCRFCDLICPELAIFTTEMSESDSAESAADAG